MNTNTFDSMINEPNFSKIYNEVSVVEDFINSILDRIEQSGISNEELSLRLGPNFNPAKFLSRKEVTIADAVRIIHAIDCKLNFEISSVA